MYSDQHYAAIVNLKERLKKTAVAKSIERLRVSPEREAKCLEAIRVAELKLDEFPQDIKIVPDYLLRSAYIAYGLMRYKPRAAVESRVCTKPY